MDFVLHALLIEINNNSGDEEFCLTRGICLRILHPPLWLMLLAPAAASAFIAKPPAPFSQSLDSNKDGWNVWLAAWDNYLVVLVESISRGAISDAVKNAMLLNAIGAEGFRLSMSDPVLSKASEKTYTVFKEAATRLFSVKGSEVRAIRDLLSRRQLSDESVGNYLSELRTLAKLTSLSSLSTAKIQLKSTFWPPCSHWV